MKKLKNIGKLMTLGGVLLAGVMIITLARSFSAVPGGSSPTDLAEALTPWNLFASLGFFVLFVGFILWVLGWFFECRNRKNKQLSNIEERLKAVEKKANAA